MHIISHVCFFTLLYVTCTTTQSVDTTTSVQTSIAESYFHEPSSVVVATVSQAAAFMTACVQAYQLLNPDINITLVSVSSSLVKTMTQTNQVDIGIYSGTQTTQDATLYPDTKAYPILSTGLAPIYNLPNMQAGFTLALGMETFGRIMAGNITNWNDTAILNDNPGVVFPNHTIHVILSNFSDSRNDLLTNSISEIYPALGALVGKKTLPNWSKAKFTNATYTTTYPANTMESQFIPYSFTYTNAGGAAQLDVTPANLINAANTVSMTFNSMQVSAIECGVCTDVYQYCDFSNAQGAYAWPITGVVYMLYNYAGVRTTCLAKQQALAFMTWFQTSATVQALATTFSLLPSIVYQTSNFPTISAVCGSSSLTTSVSSAGQLAGSNALSDFLPKLLGFYQSIDSTRQYTYNVLDQFDALAQLLNGEIDIAVLQPDYLAAVNPTLWNQYSSSNSLVIIPMAITAVIPSYNLPTDIAALTDTKLFQYPLYSTNVIGEVAGFTLDTPTLSGIMTGNINDWNHPNISQYSPWLKERIDYLQLQNPDWSCPITLVICCTDPTVDTPAAQILAMGFYDALEPGGWFAGQSFVPDGFDYDTGIANSYERWTVPFSWQTNITQLGNSINYVMVNSELQLYEAVSLYPGAFSYYVIATDGQTLSTDISIYYPPPPGSPPGSITNATCIGNVDGSLAAVIPQISSNINQFSLQMASTNQPIYSWPFSSLVSFALLSHYDNSFTESIATVNSTLNMVQWLSSDMLLDVAARSAGLGWMSMLPTYNAKALYALDYITCNGMNCLITLPTYWSLSGGIAGFGYALGAIFIIICLATSVVVFICRRRVCIRSASVMFLLLMLFGISMLFISAILIVQSPSAGSCSGFAWLVNFGLEFAFVPLFLKMFRIYKIFNRKQLKVVKLSDMKLLSYASLFLIFDIAVMAAWQGASPLQPITTHVYDGVNDTQYLQCNVDSSGQVYVLILGIEKACLLLFGCVMSFSTRKVSGTFNESTSVAWSIYNTILATAILIPIIAFVGAKGDTLIILILIMILWIGGSIYAMIFGTKMYTLALGEAAEQVSQLESQRTYTGGFSFVSVDALTKATVAQYLVALETHVRAVKTKEKQLNGKTVDSNELPNLDSLTERDTLNKPTLRTNNSMNYTTDKVSPLPHNRTVPTTPKITSERSSSISGLTTVQRHMAPVTNTRILPPPPKSFDHTHPRVQSASSLSVNSVYTNSTGTTDSIIAPVPTTNTRQSSSEKYHVTNSGVTTDITG